MMTNLFKSINLIRYVSGASLNLFRYAAMMLLVLMLGIGSAWGNHSTHYGKAVLQNATGNGTVYLSTASGSNSGQVGSSNPGSKNGTSYITWNCGGSSGSDSKTYYARGTANNGYYYAGWATSASATSYTAATTGQSFSASSTNSGSPTTTTIYGYFLEVTVGSASPASKHFDATDNSVTCSDYSADISFTTTADAKADFKDPVWSATTGHGSFANTWTVANGKATFTVTFTGDGTYGGNVASGSRSRTSSTTLTLTALPGNNSNSCTITASFPNIIVSAGSAEAMTTINTTSKTADATFPVQWADDEEDFTAAFSEISGGGAWTVNSITYAATDAQSGTITINYTFNPQTVEGPHSAKLTLSANANAGGASNYVVINAESEALAADDASVTYQGNTTKYGKLVDAISAANSKPGAVVKLLRNIPVDDAHKITSPISVTGAMTLDLNSYTIEKTGLVNGNARVFDINMSNANSVFAIMDSRTGGKIRGVGDNNSNLLTTVYVTKGILTFASGEIECVNTNTGADAKATGIRTLADAKLLMTGGTVTATSSGAQARGVYPKTAPGTENYVVISGGTINVKGATQATGIDCESSSTDVDDPTKASVVLSGVIVNVETTGTTDAIAIRTAAGVSLGIQSGTYNATTKTTTAYALQSSGYTAVLGGTFNATATTTTAHALRCEKGITAVRGGTFTATAEQKTAHGAYICDGAKLLTYGGTFKGVVNAMVVDGWATGTQVYDGGTLEAQGGTFIGEANNLNQSSEIAVCAAGIYLNNASKASYATISNATLQGKINNANLNGAASDTHRGAHGLMTRTTFPVTLTNCTISANTSHKYAFGIRSTNSSVELKNCAVTVNSSKDYNYGIYTYGTAKVEAYNTTITCISQTLRAYGAYIANGSLTAQDCDFTVKTLQTASTAAENSYLRGIYVASGKSATLNGCTVTAQGNATYSKEGFGLYIEGSVDVDNCAVTVSDINTGAYAIYNNGNTTKIGVASGKFKATATTTGVSTNGTAAAAKQQLYGGYYNTNTNLSKYLPAGYGIETLPSGSTEYSEGYRYAIRATEDVGDPVCKIGATPYTTLEEALEYASKNATSSNKLTILMVANYTLPAGDYTLPAYTNLLIPKSGQTELQSHPTRSYNTYSVNNMKCNLKLTFASGVHMDVLGTIQTGATQSAKGQTDGFNGMPEGAYGWLYLNEGSTITLENGAHLYAWGYVTGPGEIDAKRGSTVHEFFQIKDWRGGTCTSSMRNNKNKVFPLNQYYIQNVESPIKFRPGSKELCDGTANASSSAHSFDDVNLIGVTNSGSLFEMANEDMSEDTWVRKWYNPTTDQQVYEINSSASMNSISLDLYSIYTFTSSDYVLPITNNMKIHLLTGSMNITQNTELLPGAEIEIDKEATAYIASGKSLYVFDIDEWNAFTGTTHTYRLPYSPSWAGSGKTCPRSATITKDAIINVHGKFAVNGGLYTTAGGANIFSTDEDAGTIQFNVAATSGTSSVYVANNTGPTYTERPSNSAYLKNGNGTYEHTGGTASGKSWIYYDGKWNCWEERNCFGYDNTDHPYAKPATWVQLTSDVADATDHLFRDDATGNRRFLLDECIWWEVEPTPYDGNKYKCVDADHNGKYKYYEYVNNKWQEALVTITWKNGDATLATYSKTLYGTRPKYLDANPTKTKTTSEYYTWTGWTKGSANGEFFAKNAELPVATENTTYYAYFETHKFEYTISFKNYDEAVLEAKRWAHGEIPTYEGTPLKPATAAKEYTHDGWSTTKNGSKVTIPAATAAATYYAHFAESDRKYTIQWVNYNGTVLKEEQVTYNTTPSSPATPTRPNDDYYTYSFNEWSPAVSAVTSNQTYTATYNYEKKVNKYEVLFKNGTTTIFSQNLVENTVPVFDGNEPTKDATAQYSYTFDGWSTTNGGALAYAKNAALPALTANVTYYAHFAATTNSYKVLWKSEDGKQLLETDATVAYGATPEYNSTKPTKARQGMIVYTFDGWSSSVGGAKIALPSVTGDATYYAHFSDDPVYTVTFNVQGHGTAPANQEVVSGQKATQPSAPTATGYTFGGWYKEAACTNVWNFNTDVVNANTELYAKWTPNANTAYSVEHYWQNINDDNYTKHETVNMTGTTDAATAAVAKSYDGFDSALPFSQGTIAPNGSTVVKIYYNRKTYLIKWVVKLNGEQEAYKEETLRYGATPSYGDDPTKEQSESQVFSFSGWNPTPYAVNKDQTYTGSFNVSPRPYKITFVNDNGVELWHSDFGYGSTPSYGGSTPVSALNSSFEFAGWTPALTAVTEEATYTAAYQRIVAPIVVEADETITQNTTTTTTTVRVTGRLSVESSATLTTDDLILEGTPNSSGEIVGEGTVAAAQHAYYDLTKEGGFKAKTWYAVAVPWQVAVPAYDKAHNGVFMKEEGGNFVQQELGRSYDLIYYDGALRASEGHSDACWKYVEDDNADEHIMFPGRAYMIYFLKDIETIRFERKNGADLKTTTLSVVEHNTSNKKNAGWNGIANPSTYHAYINPNTMDENTYGGINYGQLYDGDRWTYTPINLDAQALVVGQPVYVQVASANASVVAFANHDDAGFLHAPRRAKANAVPLIQCEVGIAPSEGETTDRVIVRTLEDKEDAYVIAQDLLKMGVSTIVPQMWVNRYDDRLCINTVAPTGKKADYPLGISVPYDGSYEIDVLKNEDANASLYVTYNGRAIWNLSYGPYEAYLQHGTNMQYGLRVVYEAPQLVTGMEEATIENGEQIRKVMIEDKVYIIRNGEMYSITGAKVQ